MVAGLQFRPRDALWAHDRLVDARRVRDQQAWPQAEPADPLWEVVRTKALRVWQAVGAVRPVEAAPARDPLVAQATQDLTYRAPESCQGDYPVYQNPEVVPGAE